MHINLVHPANSFATNSAKITAKINKESEALEELTKNQKTDIRSTKLHLVVWVQAVRSSC